MADSTELYRRFEKAYLERNPKRRKELLQKEINTGWTTVFKIGKSSYSVKSFKKNSVG